MQDFVKGIGQIWHAVDQGAVEVEDQQNFRHRFRNSRAAMFILRNNLCVGRVAGGMQP